jgi:3-methylcrotonyl-CoA carboxylase alpha subunit
VLVANRGEIACRVMATARRLGIHTVAVYSDADAGALHVRLADEAYRIGPPAPEASYLNAGMILEAAEQTGAMAIHPGYGFLSENADFAEACHDRGFVFVGPPPDAIRAMGSKAAAKEIAAGAGVELVPGYHGEDRGDDALAEEARRLGYPILVKAVAGGGGRGLRFVEDAAGFAAAAAAARREALAAFGDDRLILEKRLDRPRHVEVQVLADKHGRALAIGDRDCSVQRRHQKVLEEAPAPGLAEATRRAMAEAAAALTEAVGYVGAGTVEFLMTPEGSFHFLEMNTRLQVEHPVTEMVTGLDLVEWQLRIAAGRHLTIDEAALAPRGHAIEARLYAEDPGKGFLPAAGTLERLTFPAESETVRVDTGVRQGHRVPVHYDPMIAKIVGHGADRAEALANLRRALAGMRIDGVATNARFLAAALAHPAFGEGAVDTGFIDRHLAELIPDDAPPTDEALAAAALYRLGREAAAAASQGRAEDPFSPWRDPGGWRLNTDRRRVLRFAAAGGTATVSAHRRGAGWRLELPDGARAEGVAPAAGIAEVQVDVDGVAVRAAVAAQADTLTVMTGGAGYRLGVEGARRATGKAREGGSGEIHAPMPGRVLVVEVEAGTRVTRGARLLVLEAMKMEHALTAPMDGTVARVHCAEGDQVEEGAPLVTFGGVE